MGNINRNLVRKRVFMCWIHTLVALFVTCVSMIVVMAIAARFGGSRIVVGIVLSTGLLALVMFLVAEPLIVFVLRARSPHPLQEFHFIQSVQELCRERGMWFTPRLYMLKLDMPNAMAFGMGLFGQYAIGITPRLYELLTRQELKAVLAHELGHIRCKDVGIMTVIVMITGGAEKMARLFLDGKTALAKTPAAILLGLLLLFFSRFVFPIGRSAISQEREVTADALAALYLRDSAPLISALRKLQQHAQEPEIVVSDLFISHPRMQRRIALLEQLSH